MFRLIVVAERDVVMKKFPIPLINRLEKHTLTMQTILSHQQQQLAQELESWAKKFLPKGDASRFISNFRKISSVLRVTQMNFNFIAFLGPKRRRRALATFSLATTTTRLRRSCFRPHKTVTKPVFRAPIATSTTSWSAANSFSSKYYYSHKNGNSYIA